MSVVFDIGPTTKYEFDSPQCNARRPIATVHRHFKHFIAGGRSPSLDG
jgi:hypothetical protein